MKKLLLVDGSNLLFQMFYGMPTRIVGKRGKPVHGTLGFVGALLKMVKNLAPTHLVVLFDGEGKNERCDVDENYKANRPDYSQMAEEETPFSQLPDIYAALDYLKIKRTETAVCETDDLIAAYALKYGGEMEIVISSFDSDFFQLITPNVRVLRYRGESSILCDEEYIRQKLGISPSQYADFKCLTGDKADNIKGISGVGAKRAAALLNSFGSLDEALKNADRIAQERLKNALLGEEERIRLNRRLIRLNGEAELPYSVDELIYRFNGERTGDVLREIGVL